MGRRSDDHHVRASATLDHEFDAYLAGVYGQWLELHNRQVPAWAWVNRVAHATVDELEQLSRGRHISPDDSETILLWQHVLTFLAKEILDVAPTERELLELQLTALIPLELDLAKHWWQAMAPIDVATEAMLALQRAPDR